MLAPGLWSVGERMDHIGGHAPDLEGHARGDLDQGIIGMLGLEGNGPCPQLQPLDRGFSIQQGDDDGVVLSSQHAIHDQQVAIMNTGTLHRRPAYTEKESGSRARNQQLMHIEFEFAPLFSRGRKAGINPLTSRRASRDQVIGTVSYRDKDVQDIPALK